MYQNSLGMMADYLLNTDANVSAPKATGVSNVNIVLNVLKMTNTILRYQKPLSVATGVVYQPVYQTSSVPTCTKYTKTH